MSSPLTNLMDDIVRSILAYLPHNAGKSSFASTGRRARTVHATTMPDDFKAWLTELSAMQQRWISGLCVAPPIRAGFESGSDCRDRPIDVMRAAGQGDDAIGRLVAYQVSLVAEEKEMQRRIVEEFNELDDEDEYVEVDADSFTNYLAGDEVHDCEELENQMNGLPVVFISLCFLSESHMNELLEAELSRYRWAVVFDYRNENNILIDPLFSLAKWGEDIVISRYEMVAAVKQNGYALENASDELKGDRDVVMSAVKQHGWALEYASAELKNDRDIVMAAVKQNGWALRYASDELKNGCDIVMAAVKMDGVALMYASDELQQELRA